MPTKNELYARLSEAEAELARLRARDAAHVRDPEHAARMLRRLPWRWDRESFAAVALSARQQPIRAEIIAIGGLAEVTVHPREIFTFAIRWRAHSVIVAHNHPSGDPDPSDDDVQLTRRLVDGGRLLGIHIVDHLVITESRAVSLAQMGAIR